MPTSSQGRSEGRGGAWRGLLWAGAAVLVIAGLLAANAVLDGRTEVSGAGSPRSAGADGTDTDPGRAELADLLARRDPDDHAAMGPVDAPVVMVAYSDYHCPYCGRWSRETHPELMPYVEAGDLRVEWRDFPVITDSSEAVSRAARAAGEQGAFWEFHEAYFEAAEEAGGDDPEPAIGRIVEDLGLDRGRFDRDRESDRVAGMVSRDFAEGQALGVTSTPAFVVNGLPLMGAQPTEVFEDAVEDALAAAGDGAGEGER